MTNDKLLNEVAEAIAKTHGELVQAGCCITQAQAAIDVMQKREQEKTESMQRWIDHHNERADAAEKREAELVDALQMNHLQNALCYGKEYTTTVLWSKTEAALANHQKEGANQ